MRVCIGGTFNILHKGHKELIDKAFKIAGKNGIVFIGVTKGEMLDKKKFVEPYEKRVKELKKYLSFKGFNKNTEIRPIYNKYGPTINEDFDVIVVSDETRDNALDINRKRLKKGKKPLKIIEIPMVYAEDLKPISSTRIYNKEINREGGLSEEY